MIERHHDNPLSKLSHFREKSVIVLSLFAALCGYSMITEKIIDVQRVQLLRSVNLKVYGDPRSRLRGHWASPDDITHLYFAEKALVVVNFGQRKDVMYRILESNADEQTVLYEVSGADYTPHTRTMVFLDDGTSWQVVGTFKSKLNYIGKEESPF